MKKITFYLYLMAVFGILFWGCQKIETVEEMQQKMAPSNEETVDPNTLNNPPDYFGGATHRGMITKLATQLGLNNTRISKLSDGSVYPDTYDYEGVVPGTQQWRHGYVFAYGYHIWGNADWWCKNVIEGTGWKQDNKTSCTYYYPNDKVNGDFALGYAVHYLEDVGNPWHTAANIVTQMNHGQYEAWVSANWTSGWNFSNDVSSSYYSVTDPQVTIQNCAYASYQVSDQINQAFNDSKNLTTSLKIDPANNLYTGRGNSTLVSLTRTRIKENAKYVKGLMIYILNKENAW